MICIYYLPLIGFLIGILTSLTLLVVLKVFFLNKIKTKVNSMDLQSGVEGLIDDRFEDVISGFKQEIPMAAAFLSGALKEKLKNFGTAELVKMTPDIKEQFSERIDGELAKESKKGILLILGSGGLVGVVLGLVAMGLMAAFC